MAKSKFCGIGYGLSRRLAALLCLALAGLPQALAAPSRPEAAIAAAGDTALRFSVRPYAERQQGTPGYYAKLDFIETRSALYPHAEEIGSYINAQALSSLFSARQDSAAADLADFCRETKRVGSACANELYIKLKSKERVGSLASIRYDTSYFPLGAAHPINGVSSYNFSLKPLFIIDSFAALFTDEDAAFPVVQGKIREALLAKRDEKGEQLLEKDTVWDGTKTWKDFETFTLSPKGITVLFSPYAVAAYAFGVQEALLPYADLKAQMKPFYRKALELE